MPEMTLNNQKIKSIKVTNGKMECIGEAFIITGDFEIELKELEWVEDKNEQ